MPPYFGSSSAVAGMAKKADAISVIPAKAGTHG
jgi:hypothetical protein